MLSQLQPLLLLLCPTPSHEPNPCDDEPSPSPDVDVTPEVKTDENIIKQLDLECELSLMLTEL